MKPPEAMVLAAGKGSRLFRSPTTIAVFLGNLIVISRGIHPGFIAICSNRAIGGRRTRLGKEGYRKRPGDQAEQRHLVGEADG